MIFDTEFLQSYDRERFLSNSPCPWDGFEGILTPEWFAQLTADFPPLEQCEKHEGVQRAHGQRPHDRYYLALEQSIYGTPVDAGKGCVSLDELAPSWQEFIRCLREDDSYQQFIAGLLGADDYIIRFAWHIAGTGGDVSPHVDAPHKYGTHIFYFTCDDNWQQEWGGQTLFMSGKSTDGQNPEVADFETVDSAPIMNNRSMLFKNTADAWHGVAPIDCPEGNYRRLFNVIFQNPRELANQAVNSKPGLLRRLLNKLKT